LFSAAWYTSFHWTEGADCTYRVWRGGSWGSGDETYMRVSTRSKLEPGRSGNGNGFRCAQDEE